MSFALALAALRRHPFSLTLSIVFAIVTASLLKVSAPVALSVWAATGLVSFEVWYLLEPTALRRIGHYRQPTHAECQRLEAALGRTSLHLLIAETAAPAAARGIRSLVVSRDLMEVFEDRALSAVLNQTAAPVHADNLAGFVLVWLGNLPGLGAWMTCRLVARFGRLLALVVGMSLVLPLILCRDAFLRWTGRLFTIVLVVLIGSILLSGGHAAAGLGLLLGWLIVPILRVLLAWESRRVEAAADAMTIAAGFGPQLLEAVDFLALAEPLPAPDKLLRVVCLPRSTSAQRADRIRRALAAAQGGR